MKIVDVGWGARGKDRRRRGALPGRRQRRPHGTRGRGGVHPPPDPVGHPAPPALPAGERRGLRPLPVLRGAGRAHRAGDRRGGPRGRQRARAPAAPLPQDARPRGGGGPRGERSAPRGAGSGRRTRTRSRGRGSAWPTCATPPAPRRCSAAAERVNARLAALETDERVDADALVDEVLSIRERLMAISVDTGRVIHDAIRAGERVLLEGAQGALLDVDHGTYPYVTSSNTTAGGAALGVGIGPTRWTRGRRGEGVHHPRGRGAAAHRAPLSHAGAGARAGRRVRRDHGPPAPLRLVRRGGGALRRARQRPHRAGGHQAGRAGHAAGAPKIATGYRGRRGAGRLPGDLGLLEEAEPVYETLPGWQTSTAEARRWEDLPEPPGRICTASRGADGTPLWYVSVGTRRDQIIHLAR
jgi:hypothetical protein